VHSESASTVLTPPRRSASIPRNGSGTAHVEFSRSRPPTPLVGSYAGIARTPILVQRPH